MDDLSEVVIEKIVPTWIAESRFPDPESPRFWESIENNYKAMQYLNYYRPGIRSPKILFPKELINFKNTGLPLFYALLKWNKPKLRSESIFIFWLWLCLNRPWRKEGEVSKWKVKTNFSFPEQSPEPARGTGGIDLYRLVYRYLKSPLINKVVEFYCYAYPEELFIPNQFIFCLGKLIDLLKTKKVLSLREIQRKLKFDRWFIDHLIGVLEEQGFIEIKEFPRKSIQVTLVCNKPIAIWSPFTCLIKIE